MLTYDYRVIPLLEDDSTLDIEKTLSEWGVQGYRMLTRVAQLSGNDFIIMEKISDTTTASAKPPVSRPTPVTANARSEAPTKPDWTPAPKTTLDTFMSTVKRGGYLILDTETTGIDDISEICQIAIIDDQGKVLLNTLVKPMRDIPSVSTAIHGITNEMVETAPSWRDIQQRVATLLAGQDIITYNATFDRKMMHRSDEAAQLPNYEWRNMGRWSCAMEAYAEFHGDYSSYRGSYTWQKLTEALYQQGLEVSEAHTALGDCLMTLELIKAMVAKNDRPTPSKLLQ